MSGSTLALRLADDVRAAAGGDRTAFHHLVKATHVMVASIAGAIVRDPVLAEDVAQEVYVAAWRELSKLKEPASFLPWIREVTRNRARMAIRGRTRRRDRVEVVDPDTLLAAAADPQPDAMERLMDQERREAVRDAVDALPDGSREVVLLYYREGESVRQVAELLDLSETAVKQRLYRARKELENSLVDLVKESAPGAAFPAAVMGVLTLGSPGAAAAATMGVEPSGGAAPLLALGWLKLPAGAVAGAAAGLAGALAGIAFGARDLLDRARDDEERRGVWTFAAMNVGLTAAFLTVLLVWPHRPGIAFGAFGAVFGGFMVTHSTYLPRVTARRKAAERQEDPEAFARRELRERRARILGSVLGLVFGGGAMVVAFLL